jgi:hypothetical protein
MTENVGETLADLSSAPMTIEIEDRVYTFAPLHMVDLAEIQQRIRAARVEAMLKVTSRVPTAETFLGEEERSGTIAKIMSTTLRLGDLLDDSEARGYAFWLSLKRGGYTGVDYKAFLKALPTIPLRDLLGIMMHISGMPRRDRSAPLLDQPT